MKGGLKDALEEKRGRGKFSEHDKRPNLDRPGYLTSHMLRSDEYDDYFTEIISSRLR